MGGRVIWCLGMYASASTWLFNVVRQVHAVAAPALTMRSHFISGAADVSALRASDTVELVKSHEVTDAATVLALARRADKMFVTMRDPRDAVSSLMLYHNYDFARAFPLIEQAAHLCMDFAKDRRALFYVYEDGFFESPATIIRIAKHLGLDVTEPQAAAIFAKLGRGEVEKYIAGMPKLPGILQDRVSGDLLDPNTHWHTHHAGRSGEIGRWRHALTAVQAADVQSRLSRCYDFGS